MASAFSAFGSKVTIVEAMDRVSIYALNKDISAEVDKTLNKGGASVNCGRRYYTSNGGHPVIVTDNGEFEVDKSLFGQLDVQQTLDALGKLADQIRRRGKIVVDDEWSIC